MDLLASNILSLSAEAAVLAEKGRIAFVNPAAAALLGADCVGKSVKDTLSPELAETQAPAFIGDVPIGDKHYLVRVNRLDNAQLIFLSSADTAPLFINDALIFSANNMLNNMSMAVDSGMHKAEELGDKTLSACLRSITRSCYSLTRIISNAGTVRSIAEGTLILDKRMTDLSLLFGSLMDTVSKLYPKDIFSLNLGQNICAPVDCKLTMQLLFNLVSNAISHSTGCSKISVSLFDNGESVVLSVSDNGSGIAPEELHRVFDRYKHGFNSGDMGKGAGLGLAVVRGVAQVHGGTLLIESRQGQGTSVRVSISKKADKPDILWADDEIYCGQIRSILTGLADCLPADCFTEKYND